MVLILSGLASYYNTTAPRTTKPLSAPLANGELIRFALTEPGAGSDATSIESEAIVFEKP